MCRREQPKSTPEELEVFFEKLHKLLKNAPEDVVIISMAMLDPHRHVYGNAGMYIRGSECSLHSLIHNALHHSKPIKEIFTKHFDNEGKERSPLSMAAEKIANQKDNT